MIRRRGKPRPAVVSIHDVAGTNTDRIGAILNRLAGIGIGSVTLLVIPGSGWDQKGLALLRDWRRQGIDIAAHGWCHRCAGVKGWRHRIHSAVLSGGAAEHLSAGPASVVGMIRRSHEWFAQRGLTPIPLYVPPAWALGPLPRATLGELPFRWYETLSGIFEASTGRRRLFPLVGFEAEGIVPVAGLTVFNRLNRAVNDMSGRPLRIAIHPNDFSLGMGRALTACLRGDHRFTGYPQILADLSP